MTDRAAGQLLPHNKEAAIARLSACFDSHFNWGYDPHDTAVLRYLRGSRILFKHLFSRQQNPTLEVNVCVREASKRERP